MLQHVEGCCLKFENGQIFHAAFVDVASLMLCSFGQVRETMLRLDMRTSSICNTQHVATGCSNARNKLPPAMLRNVTFKCCDHLAGA